MSSTKHLAMLPFAIALLLVATGCSADKAPEPTTPDAPAPVTTPTATATAPQLTFSLPTDCATILPQSRLDLFAGRGLVLLGGPGGKYGTDYLADETPEEIAGGISCIWGFADSEVSSLTISVAPLSAATRPDVVQSFADQGLNEDLAGDASTFGVQGDKTLDPAILNVLRGDSWISVIATIGGLDSYTEAVDIADEVHGTVYTAG